MGSPDSTAVDSADTASAAGGMIPDAASSGTTIYPGQSIQQRVDAYPGGTTFYLKAGVHRLQSVVPKSGDSFVGEWVPSSPALGS